MRVHRAASSVEKGKNAAVGGYDRYHVGLRHRESQAVPGIDVAADGVGESHARILRVDHGVVSDVVEVDRACLRMDQQAQADQRGRKREAVRTMDKHFGFHRNEGFEFA